MNSITTDPNAFRLAAQGSSGPVAPAEPRQPERAVATALAEADGLDLSVESQSVDSAVNDLRSFVQNISRDLKFNLDDSCGKVVVQVLDGSSGEVIRQMPSEEALALAARLDEVRSLLFKEQA